MQSHGVGQLGPTFENRREQFALGHAAGDLTGHHRRFGPDDRHLGHPVLAQDSDGVADRLRRVGVHQVGQTPGFTAQHITDCGLGQRAVQWSAQESVGRHPGIVENLR